MVILAPFLLRAVFGTGSLDESMRCRLIPSLQEDHRCVVEDFMRDLEAWSMDLQRHCPTDWNSCSATVVRFLSGSLRTERPITSDV